MHLVLIVAAGVILALLLFPFLGPIAIVLLVAAILIPGIIAGVQLAGLVKDAHDARREKLARKEERLNNLSGEARRQEELKIRQEEADERRETIKILIPLVAITAVIFIIITLIVY